MTFRSLVGCAAIAALGLGCDDAKRPPLAVGQIAGQVHFVGPVADREVRAYRVDDRGRAEAQPVGQARTDAEGRFELRGLRDEGERLRFEVDLSGVEWAKADGTAGGVYPDGLQLTSVVMDHRQHTQRATPVSLTAWSTLAVAAADARRQAGEANPVAEARAGLRAHLGFDPFDTPVAQGAEGTIDDPRRHLLSLHAWERLADRLADQAGVPRGSTLSSGALLLALGGDAGGGVAAGVIDGDGAAGPVELEGLALSAATLRGELADAIEAMLVDDPRWQGTASAGLARWLANLRCAADPASSLFPACDAAPNCDDRTPPAFAGFEPAADSVLDGVVEIRVTVDDPDSAVESVQVVALDEPAAPTALERLADRPPHTFLFDSRAVEGRDRVTLRATARNRCGLEDTAQVSYRLSNRGAGVLRGWVIKGPAKHVEVEAYRFVPGGEATLGRTLTDADGAFELALAEYAGPVLLRARAAAETPDGAPSGYLDEARGAVDWSVGRELLAVLPEFDSASESNPAVVVTPFSDLAWALANAPGWSQEAPVAAYRAALTAVGEHLGLEQPVESLLHARPADFRSASDGLTLDDPDRVMIALACFSEQAAGLGAAAFPENPDLFTALDLVRLYRADLAEDAWLDGWRVADDARIELDGQAIALPTNPLRAPFADACGRWLEGPQNRTGYRRADVSRWIEAMAQSDDRALFNPDQPATPLDVQGPGVRVDVVATLDGQVDDTVVRDAVDAELRAAPWGTRAAAGVVEISVLVEDPSGVGAVDAHLLRHDGALEVVSSGPSGEGVAQGWTLRARLDTTALDDGLQRVEVTATDRLGNTTQATAMVHVDNAAPSLLLRSPAAMVRSPTGWWANQAQVYEARAEGWAGRPAELRVDLAGAETTQLTMGPEFDDPVRLDLTARLDGEAPLRVVLTDWAGRTAEAAATLHLDRAAPRLAPAFGPYWDEGELTLGEDYEAQPLLDTFNALGEPQPVRRWLTHWGPSRNNPVVVRATAEDESADLQMDYQICLGEGCALGRVERSLRVDELGLELTADGVGGAIPVDMTAEPVPAGTPLSVAVTARDVAGNTSDRYVWRFELTALPPPLSFEEVPANPDRVVPRVSDLSFEDEWIERAFDVDGEVALDVFGFVVENPHEVDQSLTLEAFTEGAVLTRNRLHWGDGDPIEAPFEALQEPACANLRERSYEEREVYIAQNQCAERTVQLVTTQDCREAMCREAVSPRAGLNQPMRCQWAAAPFGGLVEGLAIVVPAGELLELHLVCAAERALLPAAHRYLAPVEQPNYSVAREPVFRACRSSGITGDGLPRLHCLDQEWYQHEPLEYLARVAFEFDSNLIRLTTDVAGTEYELYRAERPDVILERELE